MEQKQPAGIGAVERGVRAPALSPACQELLDALRRGVRVHGMFGIRSYYFREDTMTHCTRTVDALIRHGLAVENERTWRGSVVTAAAPPAP